MYNNYMCIVQINGKKSCTHTTWGKTPYCFWHYCYMQFRMFYLWMRPQNRGIAEALRNPDSITDWATPQWVTTPKVLSFVILTVILTFLFSAIGISSQTTMIELIAGALVVTSFAVVGAMMLGNTDILLPKILLASLGIVIIIATIIIIINPKAPTRLWGISQLISTIGILLFILPKSFQEMGSSKINLLGIGLVLIGSTLHNFSGGSPEGNNLNIGEMLGHIEIVSGMAFITSMVFAVIGSLFAVKKLWTTEEMFYRCIRPSQIKVTYFSTFVGLIIAVITGFTLLKILLLSNVLGFTIAQITAAIVAFVVGRQYGISVFTKNIRKTNLD